MLQKRIDNGSIPYGTAIAGEAIVKGSLVKIVITDGVETAMLVDAAEEALAVGFAYKVVTSDLGTIKDNDTIALGERFVIYTLVKNNVWATTQFVANAGLIAGASCSIANDGKIKIYEATEVARFVVFQLQAAGEAYTDALLNVRVL